MQYIQYVQKHIAVLVGILLIVFLTVPASTRYSSFFFYRHVLTLSPSDTNVTLGDSFTVNVNLDTGNESINAVGIFLTFNKNILQIMSVDTTSSFCTLYTQREFDTNKGVINLFCGKPNPGFQGKDTVETITFKAINYGNAEVDVNPKSLILKNNGKATNILNYFEKKQISVILSQ